MKLEKNTLFDTPKSTEDLVQWLDEFKGHEKIIAMTAASKAWNLAAEIVNTEEQSHA